MASYEGSLRRGELAADPIEQFGRWFEGARGSVTLPEAMALATVSASGNPAVRFVLLKGFGPQGFDFFTDYRSAKGDHLDANPRAALALWWGELGRQVRVSGPVARLSEKESDEYFATRPREAQIGAWASEQGVPLRDRSQLLEQVEAETARLEGSEVERPPHWGGYRVEPDEVEFWQQGSARLHDRFLYRRDRRGEWTIGRLSP